MPRQAGAERRRRARVRVEGEVRGRIHTVPSAPVIDLSESGALLEVPCSLHPGSLYVLRLPLESEVVLRSRVVRSYVHGLTRRDDGESAISYRAAVEFIDLGDRERAMIREQVAARGSRLDAALQREPKG
jgi:hypothetical protein